MNARQIQIEIFKKMSPAEKLKLSMRLYWSARRLKASWLRQQHPDWTEEQVQNKVTEIFRNARTSSVPRSSRAVQSAWDFVCIHLDFLSICDEE